MDREKEMLKVNRQMDQQYWDSERKRASELKQRRSEMGQDLRKQIEMKKKI